MLPDFHQQDRHASLKRWERGAQRAAWSQRASESLAPPLPCPWRERPADASTLRPARVLALFSGELGVVRFLHRVDDATGEGTEAGIRVIRGGIPWEQWAAVILTAWRNAAPVPDPFRLRQRLPPQWLEQALAASPADQAAFLAKLREGGLLPPLRPVSPEAVASWLRWDEMRGRLIDLKGSDAQV